MTDEERDLLDRAAEILLERAVRLGLQKDAGAVFEHYCNALDAHLSIRRVLREQAP